MLCLLPSRFAHVVPHIGKAISVPGAIAYQDDSDKQQFWYIPTAVESARSSQSQSSAAGRWKTHYQNIWQAGRVAGWANALFSVAALGSIEFDGHATADSGRLKLGPKNCLLKVR